MYKTIFVVHAEYILKVLSRSEVNATEPYWKVNIGQATRHYLSNVDSDLCHHIASGTRPKWVNIVNY